MPTGRAFVHLSPRPHYRREQFVRGLRRHGYQVIGALPQRVEPDDVCVVWNRYPRDEHIAQKFEQVGARVIVAENAYIGKDANGLPHIALALSHHSGAGLWTVGPYDRWAKFGIDLEEWKSPGDEIVLMPQRGIGELALRQPATWARDTVKAIEQITDRPIVIRSHPGAAKTHPSESLANAHCAVIWASGAGIKTLAYGVPVFHEFARWIGAPAARFGLGAIEEPFRDDRLPMFRRLAWAQWMTHEIENGEAFEWLLGLSSTD